MSLIRLNQNTIVNVSSIRRAYRVGNWTEVLFEREPGQLEHKSTFDAESDVWGAICKHADPAAGVFE